MIEERYYELRNKKIDISKKFDKIKKIFKKMEKRGLAEFISYDKHPINAYYNYTTCYIIPGVNVSLNYEGSNSSISILGVSNLIDNVLPTLEKIAGGKLKEFEPEKYKIKFCEPNKIHWEESK